MKLMKKSLFNWLSGRKKSLKGLLREAYLNIPKTFKENIHNLCNIHEFLFFVRIQYLSVIDYIVAIINIIVTYDFTVWSIRGTNSYICFKIWL